MLISKFNSSYFNYHMAVVLTLWWYARHCDAKVVKTRKHDNNHASHWKCYKGQWIRIKIQMCYILCNTKKVLWWSYFLHTLLYSFTDHWSLVLLFPYYNYFMYRVRRIKSQWLYFTFLLIINPVIRVLQYHFNTVKNT